MIEQGRHGRAGSVPLRVGWEAALIALNGHDRDARAIAGFGHHHVARLVERKAEDVETTGDVRHRRGGVGGNHASQV